MKRVRCPKCDHYIIFDETKYAEQQRLVFVCPECQKQFAIRLGTSAVKNTQPKDPEKDEDQFPYGYIVVVENVFHYKQYIPLELGDNELGRYVKGNQINKPIETVDPSVDTRHCIIHVSTGKNGQLKYILRDAPSNTGTFYMNHILSNQDRILLKDSDIITIGATTLIFREPGQENESN